MIPPEFTRALLGGVLIGAASILLLLADGKIAGISGMLVGLGTQLGSGCTSGHGVCGLGRGAARSLAATLTFIAAGALTVLVVRRALGGTV